MKVLLVLLTLPILFGCNSHNQTAKTSSDNLDSLVIPDKCFHDFIYDFMNNKDFQLSRTKISTWNYKNYYAEYDYSLHFFHSFKIPEGEFEKDLTQDKYLTIIDLDKKIKTDLIFKKIENNWYLKDKVESDFKTDTIIDFETFIYHFSIDTTYLKKHIKFPLKYTYADADKEYADTTVYLDESKVFKYNFFDKGNLMFFHDNTFKTAKRVLIYLRGLDNGLNTYYFFEKIEDEWILIKENDYSS